VPVIVVLYCIWYSVCFFYVAWPKIWHTMLMQWHNARCDASSLGDSMVFRIYTFVMRMSHNLTKSYKIF
jgi:hypothetical protein